MLYGDFSRDKYHNALKIKEKQGNPCVLLNAKRRNIEEITLYGNTFQETRSGKNLVDINNATCIGDCGDSLTIENDQLIYTTSDSCYGVILFNGTLLANTTYTISVSKSFTGTFPDSYGFKTSDDGEDISPSSNDTFAFTTGNDGTITIYYYIGNIDNPYTTSEDVLTLSNIQLEKGDTVTSYEQYGESPSPDFSSEVIGVGDKTANLFDISKSDGFTSQYGGLSNKIEGNTITVTCSVPSRMGYLNLGKFKAGQYYIGICVIISQGSPLSVYVNGKRVGAANNVFTISEDDSSVEIATGLTKDIACRFTDIQIVQANAAVVYEPYGYRIPINVNSPNLFDISQSDGFTSPYGGISSTIDGNTIIVTYTTVNARSVNLILGTFEPGSYYIGIDADSDRVCNVWDVTNGKKISTANNVITITETLTLKLNTSFTIQGVYRFKNIQITKSDVPTEYEPYYNDSINVYLNEPLYCIDNYADSITIDFNKKTAIRKNKIRKIELKANSVYKIFPNVIRFGMRSNVIKGTKILCTNFKDIYGFTRNIESIFVHKDLNNYIYFSLNKDRFGAKDEDDNNTLVTKVNEYLTNHPIYAYIILYNPSEIDISDISDTINWDNLLKLRRGTNIISVPTIVSPTNIKTKYIRI